MILGIHRFLYLHVGPTLCLKHFPSFLLQIFLHYFNFFHFFKKYIENPDSPDQSVVKKLFHFISHNNISIILGICANSFIWMWGVSGGEAVFSNLDCHLAKAIFRISWNPKSHGQFHISRRWWFDPRECQNKQSSGRQWSGRWRIRKRGHPTHISQNT